MPDVVLLDHSFAVCARSALREQGRLCPVEDIRGLALEDSVFAVVEDSIVDVDDHSGEPLSEIRISWNRIGVDPLLTESGPAAWPTVDPLDVTADPGSAKGRS